MPVAFLSSPVVQHGAVVVVVVVAAVVAEEESGQRNLGEGFPALNARLKTEESPDRSSKLRLH